MRLSLTTSAALLSGFFARSALAFRSWDVNVGQGGQLKFEPQTLTGVNIGDTITYHFFAKNHSVTQSSFSDPCHPLRGGFFSAFTPTTSEDTASATTFTITVNDTAPIWVYCGQTNGNHCQSGMVHSINAATSGPNTFDAFTKLAAKASTSTSPPTNGSPVGGLRKVHVEVGPNGTRTFSPNNITEPAGTTVEFSFNPNNHSVVQSSFQDPCHPLAGGGFSSGFVPTTLSPSGALFDIVINATSPPIWFYCAQTEKSHCQSGMVGSINAPTTGNTLEAFIGLAAKASASTIPPEAPVGGVFSANGTIISSFDGDVFDSSMGMNSGAISYIPPPGTPMSPYMTSMAGGGQPSNYNWGPTISDNSTNFLQLLQFLDNILLEVLFAGANNLTSGSWSGLYPPSITHTLQSMGAQALVHRSTSTDCLQNYKKSVVGVCKYNFPIQTVEDFVQTTLILLLLEIGLLLDVTSQAGGTDPWMIPALGTNLGSKARMTGVINMIQDHTAAAAPREVMLPAELVYSYAMSNYVVPNSCPDKMSWDTQLPKLLITKRTADATGRTTSINVDRGDVFWKEDVQVAWIGPWGGLEFTPVVRGVASVPNTLYGHVWAVLTKGNGTNLQGLASIAAAGPEIVWVTQPSLGS